MSQTPVKALVFDLDDTLVVEKASAATAFAATCELAAKRYDAAGWFAGEAGDDAEIDRRIRDAWAHPVLLGGRLYLRRGTALYAYDVRAE